MERFAMTRLKTSAIPECCLFVAFLALAGCGWMAQATQPQPPAGSYRAQDFEVRGAEATEHVNVKGAAVSDEFFAGGRIRPMLGRTILPSEHQSMQVAVISYRLWNSNFRGDPTALGRVIQVNG